MKSFRRGAMIFIVLLGTTRGYAQVNSIPDLPEEAMGPIMMDLLAFASPSPDSSRLDAYIQVGFETLSFVKEDDRYSASFEVTLTLVDSAGGQVDEKFWTESISGLHFEQTTSSSSSKLLRRSFIVPPGRYTVTCAVRDVDNQTTRRTSRKCTVRDFGHSRFAVSDIMLASRIVKVGDRISLTPVTDGNVGNFDEPFGAMVEIYARDHADSLHCRLTVSDTRQRSLSVVDSLVRLEKGVNNVVLRIPHDSLSIGDYVISAVLTSGARVPGSDSALAASARRFIIRWRGMPHSVKDIDLAIEQLYYIAKSSEVAELKAAKTSEDKQRAFRSFWKKRDPNPNTPRNEKMEEFYARVDYANRHFSHYREGWRTDMGMVYIVLGPPSTVDRHPFEIDSKPYEVWSYYDINLQCVFLDQTGFGDYRLLTPISEIYDRRRGE